MSPSPWHSFDVDFNILCPSEIHQERSVHHCRYTTLTLYANLLIYDQHIGWLWRIMENQCCYFQRHLFQFCPRHRKFFSHQLPLLSFTTTSWLIVTYLWRSMLFLQRLWCDFVTNSCHCPFWRLLSCLWCIFDAQRCSFRRLRRNFFIDSHSYPFQRLLGWLSLILDLASFYTGGHSSGHAISLWSIHWRAPFYDYILQGCLPQPFKILSDGVFSACSLQVCERNPYTIILIIYNIQSTPWSPPN